MLREASNTSLNVRLAMRLLMRSTLLRARTWLRPT
jgi:hypothetical protein